MRIYIAGPMTGLPSLNFAAFHEAERQLREIGHETINPAQINPNPAASWISCMKVDIPELLKCDGVALLPGWENSKGARLEFQIATALGMDVRSMDLWLIAGVFP